MSEAMSSLFKKGDRVVIQENHRHSFPSTDVARIGTICSKPQIPSRVVKVIFDGRKTGQYFHPSLLRLATEADSAEGGPVDDTERLEVPSTFFGKSITEWNELRLYIESFRCDEHESMTDIVRRVVKRLPVMPMNQHTPENPPMSTTNLQIGGTPRLSHEIEVGRLRKALNQIIKLNSDDISNAWDEYKEIAQQALTPTQPLKTLEAVRKAVKAMTKLCHPTPAERNGWTADDLLNAAVEECEDALRELKEAGLI
jgi:hypothetical protein